MSNLALYRKYRSKDFDSVIGQQHIVETLTTAVKNGHLSHAYLFTGPRGVGKTTVARLLARALNCLGDPKPCNQCDQCKIDLASSLDLIEIDAASNRRIDEIRELRDKIGLAPASGRFKVYIIDEVHMLTTEAFNALLKTLEEPPAHAVFILATTEAHKLPDTIISRTQRFNFKPLSVTDTTRGLADIAKLEKIVIEPAALTVLATAARGSLRDGISMLDQVASNGTSPISIGVVSRILGWGEDGTIVSLSLAIVNLETVQALKALDQLTSSGTSIDQIISQLISRWRLVLLAAAGASADPDDKLVIEARSKLSLLQITSIIDQLMTAAKSPWPDLALEASLVKLTSTSPEQLDNRVLINNNPQATPFVATKLVEPASPQPPISQNRPAATAQAGTGADLTDSWQQALLIIQCQNNPLYALIKTCRPEFNGDQLELVCSFNFHRDRLQEARNRQVVEAALESAFGRPIKVFASVKARQPSTPNDTNTASELVSSALEILGGEVVDG